MHEQARAQQYLRTKTKHFEGFLKWEGSEILEYENGRIAANSEEILKISVQAVGSTFERINFENEKDRNWPLFEAQCL